MHLPALQNQHRTEEEKKKLLSLFLILCTSLHNIVVVVVFFFELSKIQFNVQGVAHNPVPRIENID